MTKTSADADARKQARDTRDHEVLQRLGERIRNLRNLRDLTQERLAERAGLTPKFLGEVERQETNPSATSLVRIADGLSVSVGDLFDTGGNEAIPVSVEALQRLKDAHQGVAQLLTELTRVESASKSGRESNSNHTNKSRGSKKA